MSVNLSELFTGALGSDFTGMAAKFLGETPSTTHSAMGSLVPALMGTIAQKGSTAEGSSSLLNLINSPNVNPDLMNNLGTLFSGGSAGASQMLSTGQGLASSLLGSKAGGVVNALSSMSGMKSSSATSLLALAVPMILAFLKKYIGQAGLGASGLSGLLADQGEHLKSALDPRLTSALGFASPTAFLGGIGQAASTAAHRVAGAAGGVANAAGSAATAVANEAKGSIFSRPWFWISLLVLAGLLLLMNRCSTDQAQKAVDATKSAAKSGVDAVARAMKSIELPGGIKIDAPETGFIASLVAYLKGTDPTGRGIAFDDVYFDTASNALDPKSTAQLTQLAAVLKAFTSAEVGVNGYTDNTGDAAANKKLSEDRANAVKNSLVSLGVPASRINAAGFGADSPVAPNDTEDGRARNRRVELVVTKR